MTFTPIASSSAGCAYVLRDEGAPALLLDCGVSYSALTLDPCFKLSEIAGCLLSHAHGDHSKGATTLFNYGVDVFATRETWSELRLSQSHHRARPITAGIQFNVKQHWTVMPFATVHDSPGAVGFVIAGPAGKCVYLTDTAYSPVRFEGVTHFAIECNFSKEIIREKVETGAISSDRFRRTYSNHMSLERAIELFKANDLSKVQEIWLLHLSDSNSDEAAFKEAVQRATGKPVFVAAK